MTQPLVVLSDAENFGQIFSLTSELETDRGLRQQQSLGAATLPILKQRESAYPRAVPLKDKMRSVGRRCAADFGGKQSQRTTSDAASTKAPVVMHVKEYRVAQRRRCMTTCMPNKGGVVAQSSSRGNRPARGKNDRSMKSVPVEFCR